MSKINKQKSYKFGIAAEKIAAIFLRLKGYKILAERYRNFGGEIDILAKKGKILAVVEVKARKNFSDGVYSITPHKQQKIISATEYLLSGNDKISRLVREGEFMIRFDAIPVTKNLFPKHIKDAWRV